MLFHIIVEQEGPYFEYVWRNITEIIVADCTAHIWMIIIRSLGYWCGSFQSPSVLVAYKLSIPWGWLWEAHLHQLNTYHCLHILSWWINQGWPWTVGMVSKGWKIYLTALMIKFLLRLLEFVQSQEWCCCLQWHNGPLVNSTWSCWKSFLGYVYTTFDGKLLHHRQ